MWYNNRFFKYSTILIMLLLIIFLWGKASPVLAPIKNIIAILALPLIFSGLLYYLLRPLVKILEKIKIPKIAAILIAIILLISLIALIVSLAGTAITTQFNQLISEIPKIADIAYDNIMQIIEDIDIEIIPSEEIIKRATTFIEKTIPAIGAGLFSGISAIVSTLTVLFLIPFILFYFLKDDTLFAERLTKIFPSKYKEQCKDILSGVDKTLSSYIIGQAMVSSVIGVLMYIGFLIIGIRYSLILAFFAMIAAVIPFIGPFLGIIPALLVGLSYDYVMMLKIVLVMIVVQQLEGNLITPQIMGRQMRIHPVTVIIVLLSAASLFGLIGMLLAIPSYAVLRVLFENGVRIYKISKKV